MLRRWLAIYLSVILLAALLAACGGAEPAAPQATIVAEAPTDTPAQEAAAESVEGEAEESVRSFQIVPEQSEASYAVEEEFFGRAVPFVTTVGSTNAIEGEFQIAIDDNQIRLVDNQFNVDLRTLTSDSSRRDGRIRSQWLESDTYPFAEFTATAIENFPADAAEGQDVAFQIVGDMTIREITNQVSFDTVARLEGDMLTGSAQTNLLMVDYGFEPPDIMGMLRVTDGVTVTVNFVAQDVTPVAAR
jgi:polyisoprenoid-binding protein YceI